MMDDKVKRALRLVNMGISEAFCNKWLEHCKYRLEWNNQKRNDLKDMVSREYELFVETLDHQKFDKGSQKGIDNKQLQYFQQRANELKDNFKKEKKNERHDVPYLMPHEFLFLLCNTHNLLDLIQKAHKPDLTSAKGKIY